MAIIIKVDGTEVETMPSKGNIFFLAELQKAVDGLIQIVPITAGEYSDKLMIVDEEGLLKDNAKINIKASMIAKQTIVGQVIIIDKDQIE